MQMKTLRHFVDINPHFRGVDTKKKSGIIKQ